MKKVSKDVLTITKHTIQYGAQLIPIANITHIGKYVRKPTKLPLTLLILASGGAGVTVLSQARRDDEAALGVGLLALALIFLITLLVRKKRYAVSVQASSGKLELFESKNSGFIDDIIETITDVMESDNEGVRYTVNIAKAKIVDQSKSEVVMGDQFKDVKGSVINRSTDSNIVVNSTLNHALNRINQDYGEEFAAALSKVAAHVDASGNQESAKLLNTFNEELSKQDSNKTILKALWENLRKVLPDAAKVAAALATIAGILG